MTIPSDHSTASLLELMEELVASIELRDARDPDAPAWEAEYRITRLEAELARRVQTTPAAPGSVVGVLASEEALAGIA